MFAYFNTFFDNKVYHDLDLCKKYSAKCDDHFEIYYAINMMEDLKIITKFLIISSNKIYEFIIDDDNHDDFIRFIYSFQWGYRSNIEFHKPDSKSLIKSISRYKSLSQCDTENTISQFKYMPILNLVEQKIFLTGSFNLNSVHKYNDIISLSNDRKEFLDKIFEIYLADHAAQLQKRFEFKLKNVNKNYTIFSYLNPFSWF